MDNNQVRTSLLYRAAVEGDLASLQNLLAADPNLLDPFAAAGSYAETPLHVAVQLGHTEFVKEMIHRKPELSSKLDYMRSSPLHLAAAAAANSLDLVKLLLRVNPDMCSVRNKFGNNPLHVAAINNNSGGGCDMEVLKAMARERPLTVKDKAKHGNTILHLCVKHDKLEALKLLLQLVGDDHGFVNSKNDDGDTVLHLAAAKKQTETVGYLTSNTSVEVSSRNLKGLTAFNILAYCAEESPAKTDNMELDGDDHAGIIADPNHGIVGSISNKLGHDDKIEEAAAANNNNKYNKVVIKGMKKEIMLVATLIAGMAFQAGINPPGGVFQVSSSDVRLVNNLNLNLNLSPSPAPTPTPETTDISPPLLPGTPVMAYYNKELYYSYKMNSIVSFVSALVIIYLIIALGNSSFGQHYSFVWVIYFVGGTSIASLCNVYFISLIYSSSISQQDADFITYGIFLSPYVLAPLWYLKNYVTKAWSRRGEIISSTSIMDDEGHHNSHVTVPANV